MLNSLNDGTVVSISAAGVLLSTVFFTGGYIASDIETRTDGLVGFQEKLKWCREESKSNRLAWNTEGERSCGRPLGLRLIQKYVSVRLLFLHFHMNSTSFSIILTSILSYSYDQLYIIDAYHGVFRLDVANSRAEHLVSPSTVIVAPYHHSGTVDPMALLPPKFFNDLDCVEISDSMAGSEEGSLQRQIAEGVMIYFTDSSYKHTRSENRQEILDGAPRGRFFSYDTRNSELKILACGLHFPNGIQFLNEDEVLVVESSRFRVLKFNVRNMEGTNPFLNSCAENGSLTTYIQGNSNKNQSPLAAVFLDGVPGFMDNIRLDSLPSKIPNDKGKRFFIGVGTKSSQPFSLLWYTYQTLFLRELIGRFFPMKHVEKLVPKYGLVLLVDQDGEVLRSFHDPTGQRMKMVSEAQRHPVTGDIWIGSHSNPFMGLLKAKFIQ